MQKNGAEEKQPQDVVYLIGGQLELGRAIACLNLFATPEIGMNILLKDAQTASEAKICHIRDITNEEARGKTTRTNDSKKSTRRAERGYGRD